MNGQELSDYAASPEAEKLFTSLYGSESLEQARERYGKLIAGLLNFQDTPVKTSAGKLSLEVPEVQGDIRLFSAPGRTELGGNHTDHNRGKVLAASIHLDAIAAVAPRADRLVIFRSGGYPDTVVDLGDLAPRESDYGHIDGIIRGIAAEFAGAGVELRGFTAIADSAVKPGSGLSSSAAMEALFARIFDSLFQTGFSPVDLARIGQRAENVYFGKPSGLMDQLACICGGAVAIDLENPEDPLIQTIDFDLASMGYVLCVTDTRSSHSDLTEDYAAIPREMRAVAKFFGKTVLRELRRGDILEKTGEIRKKLGDRAFLRALHYFDENNRVDEMLAAIRKTNSILDIQERQSALGRYLDLVNESGASSSNLLQNIYSPSHPQEQGIALALALTKRFLPRTSASRVHGGGFAGTMQAYIPQISLDSYRGEMDALFGLGAVTPLQIRKTGAAELSLGV